MRDNNDELTRIAKGEKTDIRGALTVVGVAVIAVNPYLGDKAISPDLIKMGHTIFATTLSSTSMTVSSHDQMDHWQNQITGKVVSTPKDLGAPLYIILDKKRTFPST